MKSIRVKAILVAGVFGIVAAFCFGFTMPQPAAPSITTVVYMKGLGTESWKAVPCMDVSIEGNIVTVHAQSGIRYITSINNVVIQR